MLPMLSDSHITHNFVPENAKAVSAKKELDDDLVQAIGENRLPLRESCMEGTRTTIL